MARYVDATQIQKRMENVESKYKGNPEATKAINLCMIALQAEPTANVIPARYGKWTYNTDDFTPHHRCSVCGYNKPIAAGENIEQEPKNFCSNCGADMREAE